MRAGAAIARIARHIDHGADRGELRHQKAMGLSGPYAAGIGKVVSAQKPPPIQTNSIAIRNIASHSSAGGTLYRAG